MSRRRKAEKRDIIPDPKFNDRVLSRFINIVMYDGKKSTAEKIVYKALDIASSKLKVKNSLDLFKSALNNVKPGIEVRSRRVGGATFQIPMQIRPDRKLSLGMKWLISFSRKRNEKTMSLRLANEILAASREEGAAVKKKTDVHRMAEANKAFSHFRF